MVKKKSNKNPCSGKALPELPGRAAFFLFENAVEIRNIVEPAVVSHFCNRIRGIDQYAARMTQADFGEAVNKSISRSLPEETTEGNVGHIREFGHFR